MKDELLNYLKLSIARNWLDCYSQDLALIPPENYSSLLNQRTKAKIAEILCISGQKPQATVVFVLEENPVDFIAAFLAGVITGVQLFLCNPAWQQGEWQQVLNLVEPNLLFGEHSTRLLIRQLQSLTKIARLDAKRINTDESLIMIPTGGTSGRIKFAIHTWSTLIASVTGFQEFFNSQKINSWCTLPLYHVSGLMQLMRSLVTQGDLVIAPYQLTNLKDIDRTTYFISLVPTQLQWLLDNHAEWLKQFKTVLVGGAPAQRSLLERAREQRIAIAPIYGSTETASGVVALKPEDFWAGNTSNGKVLPHAQVSIKAGSSDRHPGSIVINSKSLFQGYYPHLSTSIRPLITDDLGYIDTQGYIYLVGRNSHKIITGGENVFPQEVETAIYNTGLVDDVCVFGISDQYWGQAVTAVYVAKNINSEINTLKQQIQSQLAKYKQPKNWIEVEQLPRNDRGKIDYQQLEAIAISKINPQHST